MNELLLRSAQEPTDVEAGGHGNRWAVFDDEWRPALGQCVSNTLWLQAYACGVADAVDSGSRPARP